MDSIRRMLINGAGGRDFHEFDLVSGDDPRVEMVGFTATQIPGVAGRRQLGVADVPLPVIVAVGPRAGTG